MARRPTSRLMTSCGSIVTNHFLGVSSKSCSAGLRPNEGELDEIATDNCRLRTVLPEVVCVFPVSNLDFDSKREQIFGQLLCFSVVEAVNIL